MDDIDPNTISNGTCYWAKGKKMHPSYIPCGNNLFGHKHCCWAGDSCLVDNACFGIHGGTGDGTYLTYLAGCSDPEYEDPSCPDKKPFHNQPWAGMILCPDDVDTWVWLACSERGAPTTPARGDPCTCPHDKSSRTAAFTVFSDGTRLSEEGKLPITLGGTINFNDGMEPTITTTLTFLGPSFSSSPSTTSAGAFTSGSGSNSGASAATVTSTATSKSIRSPSSDNPTPSPGADGVGSNGGGLSTGAKAGIGVGAGVVGLALLGAIIFLVMRARRSREVPPVSPPLRLSPARDQHQGCPVEMPEGGRGSNSVSPITGISEMESAAARPWSLRSELDTTGPGTSPPLGEYSNGHHLQPQNFSPGQPVYGNSYGIQHNQHWSTPYPPDDFMGVGPGTSMTPEAQPGTGRHGGSHYIHELA